MTDYQSVFNLTSSTGIYLKSDEGKQNPTNFVDLLVNLLVNKKPKVHLTKEVKHKTDNIVMILQSAAIGSVTISYIFSTAINSRTPQIETNNSGNELPV